MQLFTAQLDNWVLNIFDISDSIAMAIAKHEFANTDGAYMQHMGNHPREVSFKAYFFGSEADVGTTKSSSYANHFDFLNQMEDSNKSHILIHPKYGVLNGYVETLNMLHDDTQDYVVIDIKFVQKDIQTIGTITTTTILSMESATIKGLNNILAAAATTMSQLGMSPLIGKTIDFTQSISSQVNNVSQDLRSFCNELDTNINNFDTFLHDVTAPLTSIDASVAYVSDIPSRLIGSINGACNRLVTSLSNISNLPVQFINNMTLGLDNLYRTITGQNANFFQVQFRSTSSALLNNVAGNLLQVDEDNRNLSLSRETKPAFDLNGNRINVAQFQTFMTTNDLSNMMSLVRKYTQQALILDRGNQDLKTMSAALMQFINDIKLKRLTVKTITVSNIPIHALLLQLGLPYEASDRILALNPQVTNPSYLTGAIKVYSS